MKEIRFEEKEGMVILSDDKVSVAFNNTPIYMNGMLLRYLTSSDGNVTIAGISMDTVIVEVTELGFAFLPNATFLGNVGAAIRNEVAFQNAKIIKKEDNSMAIIIGVD